MSEATKDGDSSRSGGFNGIVVALLLWRTGGGMNARGALLHVFGDLLGSVAALIAGAVIYSTGWTPIDPILSLVVFSFTESPVPNVWAGFSLRWYQKLVGDAMQRVCDQAGGCNFAIALSARRRWVVILPPKTFSSGGPFSSRLST